jgi:hypothetical protein
MKLLNGFSWFLNPVWIMDKFFTLWGGGGGSQTSTGTTYTTNVPEYMQPYFEQVAKSAGKNIFTTDSSGNVTGVKGMPEYSGERVAGFNDAQIAIQNQIKALQDSGQYDKANEMMNQAATMSGDLAKRGFDQAFAYKPEDYQAEDFTGAMADKYMSPYQQRVTDMALRENNRQAALAKKNAMLSSIGRGTRGGGRSDVMQGSLLRDQMANASDIQAKGSQSAYENAQNMYKAYQDQRLNAYKAREASKQFGANLGRDIGTTGLSSQISSSKGLADLATAQQTAKLERLKAQASSAREKQDIQQKIDDVNYQTAMEKRDWEKKQLEWINSIIHGTQGIAGSQVQYAPSPSGISQIAGLGLGGLGLAKAFGG